jgi:hypothetical protein
MVLHVLDQPTLPAYDRERISRSRNTYQGSANMGHIVP